MIRNFGNQQYYHVGESPFLYAGDKCNNNCIFCFEKDRKFLFKDLDQINSELKLIRKKYDFLNIMGREPTLRRDIIKIINLAKVIGFKTIGLTSNGRMFSYAPYAKSVLGSGLNQIGVTVMGITSSMHDWHTKVPGSFNQTLAGIKNILKYADKDFSMLLNIMVTQKNYKYLEKIVDFYYKLGIREMNIGHIMPINKSIVNSKKVVAKLRDVVPELIEIYKKYENKVKFFFVEYPACVFSKEYRNLAFPCLEENPDKRRIALCEKCSYGKKCAGIPLTYTKLYGSGEFKL